MRAASWSNARIAGSATGNRCWRLQTWLKRMSGCRTRRHGGTVPCRRCCHVRLAACARVWWNIERGSAGIHAPQCTRCCDPIVRGLVVPLPQPPAWGVASVAALAHPPDKPPACSGAAGVQHSCIKVHPRPAPPAHGCAQGVVSKRAVRCDPSPRLANAAAARPCKTIAGASTDRWLAASPRCSPLPHCFAHARRHQWSQEPLHRLSQRLRQAAVPPTLPWVQRIR